MAHHLVGGEFQSDKYPDIGSNKVVISLRDIKAQAALWEIGSRYCDGGPSDEDFGDDLQIALLNIGYAPRVSWIQRLWWWLNTRCVRCGRWPGLARAFRCKTCWALGH